ncbi:MAG TPA: histidine kinase [Pseudonocardiaceae bacterium]
MTTTTRDDVRVTQQPWTARFGSAVREILSQRRWLLLPVPLVVGNLVAYQGPYPIAGGYLTAYLLAAAVIIANVLMVRYRRNAVWVGPASLMLLALAGGVLTAAMPSSTLIVLPYYAVATAARRYVGWWMWILLGVGVVALFLSRLRIGHLGINFVAELGVLAAVAGWSFARRTRVDRLEQMELALAREQTAREEHARAAALDERARIAREVHDVLAHSLSALSLNLQGARLMLTRDGASQEAINQVERAQKLAANGLAEARRAVSALREDTVPAARSIADLVTATRLETGTPIEFTLTGTPRNLSGSADATLYRTAQEALSNARKHAAGAPVDVELSYLAGRVELTVTDAQGRRPTPGPSGGYGLIGMRERAELIGGELALGPTETGWRVHLVVPS